MILRVFPVTVLVALVTLLLVGLPQKANAAQAISPWVQYESRLESCIHFAGEEPYDRARARFLKKTMSHLDCDRLKLDFRGLAWKYRDVPSAKPKLDHFRQLVKDAWGEDW